MSLRRFALAALASALVSGPVAAATQLLNVSYDPTRELYQAYNAASSSTGRPRAART